MRPPSEAGPDGARRRQPWHRRAVAGGAPIAVLYALSGGDWMLAQEIERETGLHRATVYKALDHLTALGYVESRPVPVGHAAAHQYRCRVRMSTEGWRGFALALMLLQR